MDIKGKGIKLGYCLLDKNSNIIVTVKSYGSKAEGLDDDNSDGWIDFNKKLDGSYLNLVINDTPASQYERIIANIENLKKIGFKISQGSCIYETKDLKILVVLSDVSDNFIYISKDNKKIEFTYIDELQDFYEIDYGILPEFL